MHNSNSKIETDPIFDKNEFKTKALPQKNKINILNSIYSKRISLGKQARLFGAQLYAKRNQSSKHSFMP